MARYFLLISIITLTTLGVLAHEFWLEPQKFFYQKNEAISVKFLVGENFTGENWRGNKNRVNTLELYKANSRLDISSLLGEATGDSLQLTISEEGTAMIVFNSNNSFIRLEADKFDAYLKEDGLTEVLEYRRTHNLKDSAGREYYQRSVKTILQVGSIKTSDYNKKTSLPIDIIPLLNPYSIKDSATLSFKILFKGNPLPGALCKIWNQVNGKTTMYELKADKQGELKLAAKPKGKWMVSTVKMIPATDPLVQWQSYWGSVTWGY